MRTPEFHFAGPLRTLALWLRLPTYLKVIFVLFLTVIDVVDAEPNQSSPTLIVLAEALVAEAVMIKRVTAKANNFIKLIYHQQQLFCLVQ